MSQYYVPIWFGDSPQELIMLECRRPLDQNGKPRESHYQHANRVRVLELRSALEGRWQIEAR